MILNLDELTADQLDGLACVVCDSPINPMRPIPAVHGWHTQLFACTHH